MTDPLQDAPSVEQPQAWNEQQYKDALAHLERLQDRLDSLRSAIPSFVTPLIRPSESKAQMFADIKKGATQSTNNLRAFRENWTSEQTQQLLVRANESLKADGDTSKAANVARYGWSED